MPGLSAAKEAVRKVVPVGDLVMVYEDEAPEKVGAIYLPETISQSAVSGTVVGLGPSAPKDLLIGTRIWFRQYSGTRIKLEGEAILLLDPSEVVCFEAGGQEVRTLEPLAGEMLVLRDEVPEAKGMVILPHGYRTTTLSATATVVNVGAGVRDFCRGDRVLLTSNIGKSVEIDGTKYLRVKPYQIMLRLREDADGRLVGRHPFDGVDRADWTAPAEAGFEEGDTRSLR